MQALNCCVIRDHDYLSRDHGRHQYQTEQQLFQREFEKYESVGCQTGNHDLCCNGNQTYNSRIQQITEKRYCFDHFQVMLQCRSIR